MQAVGWGREGQIENDEDAEFGRMAFGRFRFRCNALTIDAVKGNSNAPAADTIPSADRMGDTGDTSHVSAGCLPLPSLPAKMQHSGSVTVKDLSIVYYGILASDRRGVLPSSRGP